MAVVNMRAERADMDRLRQVQAQITMATGRRVTMAQTLRALLDLWELVYSDAERYEGLAQRLRDITANV
jgi:hypothetical protein